MCVEWIDEVEGEGHAVAIRLDVWQRSGTTVKCFPRSHAPTICKVAAIAPMPENGPPRGSALPIVRFLRSRCEELTLCLCRRGLSEGRRRPQVSDPIAR